MKPNGYDIAELLYDITKSWGLKQSEFWFEPSKSEDISEIVFQLGEIRSDNSIYHVKMFELLNNLNLKWYIYNDNYSIEIVIDITTIDIEMFNVLLQSKKYNL